MANRSLPDHELLQRCREGNTRAFDLLFERYFNKLNLFALKYIRQQSITEELIMDLMLKVWEKKDSFQEEGSLGPYLFKALKNSMIDYFRKKELSTTPICKLIEDSFTQDTTNEAVSYNELQKIYLDHLNQLSPQRKLVFEMSRHENLSYRQIATNLNLSVKTVESHVSAALLFLRKKMRSHVNLILTIITIHFL
ncbi:RNA polymerase sigma-70 factor [Pedobacter panaciterrae]|jgi:RNA polymerase sigma-70 factor, Bacteroides expansion family 1|uniref:RNA polymerase sigma-70 factor n=1 Tax=Pedobacter panaciterrae TaxID=363849 RepID=A0ABU8NTC5_9SPHI|nr:RNA polymerase sigma-70 factor [Pedobacter panaciterrae]NQX55074.1 RNA polymerase sigma-70 factor [Pedobacter panaciterrae]